MCEEARTVVSNTTRAILDFYCKTPSASIKDHLTLLFGSRQGPDDFDNLKSSLSSLSFRSTVNTYSSITSVSQVASLDQQMAKIMENIGKYYGMMDNDYIKRNRVNKSVKMCQSMMQELSDDIFPERSSLFYKHTSGDLNYYQKQTAECNALLREIILDSEEPAFLVEYYEDGAIVKSKALRFIKLCAKRITSRMDEMRKEELDARENEKIQRQNIERSTRRMSLQCSTHQGPTFVRGLTYGTSTL